MRNLLDLLTMMLVIRESYSDKRTPLPVFLLGQARCSKKRHGDVSTTLLSCKRIAEVPARTSIACPALCLYEKGLRSFCRRYVDPLLASCAKLGLVAARLQIFTDRADDIVFCKHGGSVSDQSPSG